MLNDGDRYWRRDELRFDYFDSVDWVLADLVSRVADPLPLSTMIGLRKSTGRFARFEDVPTGEPEWEKKPNWEMEPVSEIIARQQLEFYALNLPREIRERFGLIEVANTAQPTGLPLNNKFNSNPRESSVQEDEFPYLSLESPLPNATHDEANRLICAEYYNNPSSKEWSERKWRIFLSKKDVNVGLETIRGLPEFKRLRAAYFQGGCKDKRRRLRN